MIRATGLAKRFGRRDVLTGLDVAARAGHVTALIGANGAGKTTLIKILLGLTRSDSGTISVDGRPLDGSPGYRAIIGYMPQIARFPAHASGRDLLGILTTLRGAATPADLSLVEAFGLAEQFERPLGVLSGGTRQKVNAVLAFAFQPRLLILDEPTAGLDPLACRVLKDRILAERAVGTTVLITSHVLPELEELADDALCLDAGRAAWQGPVDQLKLQTASTSLERAVAGMLRRTPEVLAR
ncbi:MAG TPA: ABC transporter ATP-binding protein [Gemmatimonadales bacterium]|nr:ABC transporter ATP-binding protein [Gemmatimonadales bacterium]